MVKYKVFGIGWAKTGTTTLGECLRILGYNHQSQDLDLVFEYDKGNYEKIYEAVSRYDSFEDWPWILIYEKLDRKFPGSKFILTERESSSVLKSYTNMINQRWQRGRILKVREIIYGFSSVIGNESVFMQKYLEHNKNVKKYFEDRPDDLLIINWSKGDGWGELCRFLDKKIPGNSFPHANKGFYSNKILRKVKGLLNYLNKLSLKQPFFDKKR